MEEQIRSLHLLMALVGKPKLAHCDGLWPADAGSESVGAPASIA
jgi:hypothetical protein